MGIGINDKLEMLRLVLESKSFKLSRAIYMNFYLGMDVLPQFHVI